MKYLLLFLVVAGCSDSIKCDFPQDLDKEKVKKLAQSYIGMCYTTWHGDIWMIEPGPKSGMYSKEDPDS